MTHAVLLAAGAATRLRPLTDATPKCLLDVGGRSILSRAIATLAEHGVRRVTIVDGFQGDALRAALLAEFPREWFTFVRNELWSTTNNAYSLWLARHVATEPMLLLDSDIVFDPRALARLLEAPYENRLALRTRGGLGEEEMKVELDAAGRVRDIGKTLPVASAAGESVGLEVFSASTANALFDVLDRRMLVERRVGEWYEAAFVELVRRGAAIHPVDLGDLACMEIDTVDDLEAARRVFGRR